jgi:hypothetical protein
VKRRSLLQAVVLAPALAKNDVKKQSGTQENGRVPAGPPVVPPGETETPNIPVVPADQTADEQVTAFNEEQMRAFRYLADVLIPPYNGMPGANDTGAPEFLSFLIGASQREKVALYRGGLDQLNRHSHERFNIEFAQTNADQADELLAPLRQPWDYEAALRDDFGGFLLAAKRDLLRATVNSRVYIEAISQVRRPRNASRYYWFPIP